MRGSCLDLFWGLGDRPGSCSGPLFPLAREASLLIISSTLSKSQDNSNYAISLAFTLCLSRVESRNRPVVPVQPTDDPCACPRTRSSGKPERLHGTVAHAGQANSKAMAIFRFSAATTDAPLLLYGLRATPPSQLLSPFRQYSYKANLNRVSREFHRY